MPHSILADGLWVAGADSAQRLRFEPLPSPATAEIEKPVTSIAERATRHVARVWESEGSGYLDPRLAALVEAFFFSRTSPVATRSSPTLTRMEGDEDEESTGSRGKALCASVQGFSLHAAQAVGAQDREALERLLRYGLRAPFAQERLSVREDGKVVYRLHRPCRTIAKPLFANRSRARRLLPPPPRREDLPGIETGRGAATLVDGDAPAQAQEPPSASDRPPRSRAPWAQLLRRVLHVDALSCPQCSTHLRAVPMVVLAFLTDSDVMGKILHHLGLPATAPTLAPARHVSEQALVGPYAPPVQTQIELGRVDEGSASHPFGPRPEDAWDRSGVRRRPARGWNGERHQPSLPPGTTTFRPSRTAIVGSLRKAKGL